MLLRRLSVSFIVLLFSSTVFARLLPSEVDAINVFKRIAPYVVNVHRLKNNNAISSNGRAVSVGSGSGVIWNNAGYVVTNYHVVKSASKVAVSLSKGITVRAKIVGVAPRDDLAVLKIQSKKNISRLLPKNPLPVANSHLLRVGQVAIAIGNPFGLSRTLTEGVVSALNRSLPMSKGVVPSNMVQTDASINPGNSGGPLLNSSGSLIGINSMIVSKSGGSSGIGFAIPSNKVKQVVTQLIRYGKVIQPGIGILAVSDYIARQAGVKGVVVYKVLPNTPASKAGMVGLSKTVFGKVQLGDVIIGIDRRSVKSFAEFSRVISKKSVGSKITIHIVRGGKRYNIQMRVANVG
jgi:S1-C subfamily serine protease